MRPVLAGDRYSVVYFRKQGTPAPLRMDSGATRESPLGSSELLFDAVRRTAEGFYKTDGGPGGTRGSPGRCKRTSAWGTRAKGGEEAVEFLNESSARQARLVLADNQKAFYLHVDDGAGVAALRAGGSAPEANRLMNFMGDSLEKLGFLV